MEQFLASVERKAFTIARIATGHVDEALDIVQDSMLKLVQKYAHKTVQEWPALFYRILNSRITDWYRRKAVRGRWQVSLPANHAEQQDSVDPCAQVEAAQAAKPEEQIVYNESVDALETVIQQLPLRQQQAFMLRMWEGLSVEETAQAMGCSTGSVKTHCSRALEKLRQQLLVETT